jgi:hypothetical protein
MVQGYEPQALDYLLGLGYLPSEIHCEVENKVPIVAYRYRKRNRKYIPDIYLPRDHTIIEVKSMDTLGLLRKRRRGWGMTCAKAIACHKAGYKFALLLMTRKGQRIPLPKNWAKQSKEAVRRWVEENTPRNNVNV